MPTAYHSFGPAAPSSNTGAAGAFETIGTCLEGGDIEITHSVREIKSDAGGDEPVEFQAMGSRARITFDLASWDDAVIAKLAAKAEGAAEGLAVAPGALLGTGSFLFQLYIPSATDLPWLLYHCRLANHNHKPGTAHKPRRLVIDAIRFVAGTATSAAGVKLYQRAAP